MNQIKRPRGTRDLDPEEMERRISAQRRMEDLGMQAGFRPLGSPTFELADLFRARSGPGIVDQMYVFEDKSGRELALRPEITASVARHVVNDLRAAPRPLRFQYFGPCFRYERPQSGRYREFWQFGIEVIGGDRLQGEAEVLALAWRILQDLQVHELTLAVGHIGLVKGLLHDLDTPVQAQVLRAFDKGDDNAIQTLAADGAIPTATAKALADLKGASSLAEAGSVLGDVTEGAAALDHLIALGELLEAYGITWDWDLTVVRGLDYYTGVVFEFHSGSLGAESQVLGGGTYSLLPVFGGREEFSCGFALGFDRVLLAAAKAEVAGPTSIGVLAHADAPAIGSSVVTLVTQLRSAGLTAVLLPTARNLGKAIAAAGRDHRFLVILGADEIAAGEITIKDLANGEQERVPVGSASAHLRGLGARGIP